MNHTLLRIFMRQVCLFVATCYTNVADLKDVCAAVLANWRLVLTAATWPFMCVRCSVQNALIDVRAIISLANDCLHAIFRRCQHIGTSQAQKSELDCALDLLVAT